MQMPQRTLRAPSECADADCRLKVVGACPTRGLPTKVSRDAAEVEIASDTLLALFYNRDRYGRAHAAAIAAFLQLQDDNRRCAP